ncbi:hypothetical protein, partial [Ketobacter sp.]
RTCVSINNGFGLMRFFTFFLSGLLLGAVVWMSVIYTLIGTPGDSSIGLHETFSIKKDILTETPSPRIIFVGGSGVLMGVGADIINELVGVPTVNFGIWAGFDLVYQMHNIKEFLRDGDVVVFSFEYTNYDYPTRMSEGTRQYVMQRDESYFLEQPVMEQLNQIFTLGPEGFYKILAAALVPNVEVERAYPIEKINEFGDQTVNRVDKPDALKQRIIKNRGPDNFSHKVDNMDRGLTALADQIEVLRDKKEVKFLATYPNTIYFKEYEDGHLNQFEDKFEDFFEKKDIPVLGAARDFMYPKKYFYDTAYHLNNLGVEKRSKALAELLLKDGDIQKMRKYWKNRSS